MTVERPTRKAVVHLESLVDASSQDVLVVLGEPDKIEPGDTWLSDELGTVMRDADGELHQEDVYGPIPTKIAAGDQYVTWYYYNVVGPGMPDFSVPQEESREPGPDGFLQAFCDYRETWMLYLVRHDDDEVVVEVYRYDNETWF